MSRNSTLRFSMRNSQQPVKFVNTQKTKFFSSTIASISSMIMTESPSHPESSIAALVCERKDDDVEEVFAEVFTIEGGGVDAFFFSDVKEDKPHVRGFAGETVGGAFDWKEGAGILFDFSTE